MLPTLNYMSCTDCGLRGKVPRGPDVYAVGDMPETARECPRCGNYLQWHALPYYGPYRAADIAQLFELARVSLNRIELAWRSTPLGRKRVDFAFAQAFMRAHA
jgi:hypothetical protein